jgi:hypothetical protein
MATRVVATDFSDAAISTGSGTHDLLAIGSSLVLPIQYEAGTRSDAWSAIAGEALEFHLRNAVIPAAGGTTKGRVQLVLADVGKIDVYQRFRMRFGEGFNALRTYPGVFGEGGKFLTICEHFAGADWLGQWSNKVSLNIAKDAGVGQPLHLTAWCLELGFFGSWSRIWMQHNRVVTLPVGEWLDIAIGYRSSRAKTTGRFWLDMNGVRVLDVTGRTQHPWGPILTHWHPLKIYTGGELAHYARDAGSPLRIDWDDLELWDGWPL